MKKRILTIILSVALASAFSYTVMAEPQEDLTEEVAEEEEIASETNRPVGSITDLANGYEYQNFDEMGDFIVKSSSSDYNCSQINFHCMIPDGFTHGVILELKNETDNQKFRLVATHSNKYSSHMAVPAGSYRVLNCYVDGDTTLSYPMSMPSDFRLEEKQTLTVESTLKNYAEIESEAKKRSNPEKEKPKEEPKETVQEPQKDTDGIVPWRRVKHTGEGSGVITIIDSRGGCKVPLSLVVEITGTGGDKKGEYRYSTDGGITWADTCVIRCDSDAAVITTDSQEDTGLKMRFENGQFLVFDKYYFDCDIEYPVSTDVLNGNGSIRVSAPTGVYNDSYKLRIKMVKTGGLGSGVFVYSLNGGLRWSEEEIIPKSGAFNIPESPIIVTFWANEQKGDTFMVSDMYTCDIRGDMSNRSVAPYVIGLILLLAAVAYFVAVSLRNQKSKPWEYTLNVYTPVELKQKRSKKT